MSENKLYLIIYKEEYVYNKPIFYTFDKKIAMEYILLNPDYEIDDSIELLDNEELNKNKENKKQTKLDFFKLRHFSL